MELRRMGPDNLQIKATWIDVLLLLIGRTVSVGMVEIKRSHFPSAIAADPFNKKPRLIKRVK